MNRRSSFLFCFFGLVLSILFGCSTERATETASPQLPKQLEQTPPSAADAPPPPPTSYFYPTTDVTAPIPTSYPSTEADTFDPLICGLHANWEAQESQGIQPVRYDPVNEVTVPQSLLDRKDMIGAYRDGSGFRRLTLHESGRYEYVDGGGGCMYSYSGYEGDWELEDNVIRLRNAQPNAYYQSLYYAAAAPTCDPFLNFDVLLLENEPILIESDKMYHFVKYGVSNRCCFRRSGDH